jgi:multiple sugar transport system substrate-binding protein
VIPALHRRDLLASGLLLALPAVAQQALQIAAFPLVDKIAGEAAAAWRTLQPGVPLQVVSRQYRDHHVAMNTALSTDALLPDLMVLEASQLGRFSRGTGLQELDGAPFGADSVESMLTPFALTQGRNERGRLIAMPADIGPGTMLVRHDVLERAGVDTAMLTRSWDDYLIAGERIRSRTGAFLVSHVQLLKDILLRHGLLPGEGQYYDADSKPLLHRPRFRRCFELIQQVRELGLDARVNTWSNEWAEALRRGRLASELGGAWLVGQLSSWVAPATAGLWRASQLPEGTQTSYGGAFYAIPRRLPRERQLLAWQFIRLVCLDRELQLQAFRRYDAFPALRAAQQGEFFDEALPFLGGQPARRLWAASAQQIQSPRPHRQDPFAEEVVGTELDKVLLRGKSIDLALEDAERLLARRAKR